VVVDALSNGDIAQGGDKALGTLVHVARLCTAKDTGACGACLVGGVGIKHFLKESGGDMEGFFFDSGFYSFKIKVRKSPLA